MATELSSAKNVYIFIYKPEFNTIFFYEKALFLQQ